MDIEQVFKQMNVNKLNIYKRNQNSTEKIWPINRTFLKHSTINLFKNTNELNEDEKKNVCPKIFEKYPRPSVPRQRIYQNENMLRNDKHLEKNEPKKIYESSGVDQKFNNGSSNFFKNQIQVKCGCQSNPRVSQSNMHLCNSLRELKNNPRQPIDRETFKETREPPLLKDFFISKNYPLKTDSIKSYQSIKQKLHSPSLAIFLVFPRQSSQRFYH